MLFDYCRLGSKTRFPARLCRRPKIHKPQICNLAFQSSVPEKGHQRPSGAIISTPYPCKLALSSTVDSTTKSSVLALLTKPHRQQGQPYICFLLFFINHAQNRNHPPITPPLKNHSPIVFESTPPTPRKPHLHNPIWPLPPQTTKAQWSVFVSSTGCMKAGART